MATRMTQVNLARLSRRTGGLDRLAGEYKQQVAAMTDEYSRAFGDYTQRVNATMAPYEAAVQQYQNVAQPAYQQQVADYNAKLEAYRQQLADLEKDPVIERTGERQYRTWYGKRKTEQFTYYEPKPIPTFDAKMPELPDAPVAPQIEKFDSSAFESQRSAAASTLQREVGERRASRLNTARRGAARPLLQGEKA